MTGYVCAAGCGVGGHSMSFVIAVRCVHNAVYWAIFHFRSVNFSNTAYVLRRPECDTKRMRKNIELARVSE